MSSRINVGKVCPIPKGNWTSTTTYEKLNMVNKSGVLYIAKQDVPANTAITNTNYWMQANGSLSIGTVETVSSSTPASATISDSTNGPVLNLSIPKGVTGNESIDDTKGFGDIDYVWSADKSYNEINNKLDANSSIKTGNIVEFDAKTDHAIKDLTVGIEPMQDLHGYDNPWPAGGNKNLYDYSVYNSSNNGITSSLRADGKFTISGKPTTNYTVIVPPITITDLLEDGQTYTLSKSDYTTGSYVYVQIVATRANDTKSYYAGANTSSTFTVDKTTYSKGYTINVQTGTTADWGDQTRTFTYGFMLEKGSSATTFVPHSNICPISGHSSAVVTRTGKNLLQNIRDASVETNGITFTKNTDGSVTLSGTASATAYYNINYLTTVETAVMDFVPLRGKQLALSVSETAVPNVQMSCEYFREDGSYAAITNATVITSGNFTVPSDAYRARTYLRVTSGAVITTPVTVYPMLLVASDTDRTYEPYQGTAVTVDLDGTRYGGSLDVTAGVLTVDRAIVTLSDISTLGTSGTGTGQFATYETGISCDASKPLVCERMKSIVFANRGQAYQCYINPNSITALQTFVPSDATVESVNTALSGSKVVIPLASPLTVTLTPAEVASLIGHNVLWCDTGNSTVVLRLTTGDLAYQDDIDYTSSQIKNKPTLGTMASKDDATSDTKAYGRKDGAWYDLDGRYYTESELDDKLAAKADIIRTSASGSLVHITDGAAYPVDNLTVSIEPVQDLHGYDNPWPAGGGKNLLHVTATSEKIYTVSADGIVTVNGTSDGVGLILGYITPSESTTYKLNGCPSGGGDSTYRLDARLVSSPGYPISNSQDTGSGSEFTASEQFYIFLRIPGGATVSNKTFYPMVRLASVSDATFSPYANVCPISGHSSATVTRTGKNLFDKDSTDVANDKCLNSSGALYDNTNWRVYYIPVKAGVTYSLSGFTSNEDNVYFWWMDSSKQPVSAVGKRKTQYLNITAPTNAFYLAVCCVTNPNSAKYDLPTVQIELGSSATAYESPHIQTITIDLGSTVYGAQLDAVAGTLTVTHKGQRLLSTMPWTGNNGWNPYCYYTKVNDIKLVSGYGSVGELICTHLKKDTPANLALTSGYHIGVGQGDGNSIFVNFGQFATADDLKAFLADNEVYVVYPLATPTVITGLTPAQISLLLGENNVWNDTGSTELTYAADSKMYIDKKFAELQALILEN